ncbi:9588_t:CDS:2 [Cetraspora pellucida]|uniref:9588_t:CDS:1 n=1 Tax=Cetraspora pellucida TaxID=1433469 RepID=A0ACA9KJT9_9GLOM|nr:9588_t:CDS:2 [Cetraspora pellucida]
MQRFQTLFRAFIRYFPRNFVSATLHSQSAITINKQFLLSKISHRRLETRHVGIGYISTEIFFTSLGCRCHYSTNANEKNAQSKNVPTIDWKTLSFYSFHAIPNSHLHKTRELLLSKFGEMGIVGRIYIATEGINAQLSCPIEQLDELRKVCDQELKLGNVEFNFSTIHVKAFRKLNVKIRNQIVSDGLEKGSYDLSNQPKHLSPEEWHAALSNAKTPIVLIDMRNHYESEIGYFEDSIRQDGGITAYGRYITSNPSVTSLYKGRNFTFDKRLGEPITNDIVSQCHTCGEPCDIHTNFQAWDEKFGRPSGFDDVKPGYQCVYDHVHRTRPKLVIERLGGTFANVPSDLVEMLLEKNSTIKN